jgi:ParB/RepB/Spo0J family partition protein
MNAPATSQQQIALLPIGNLFPSPTNPRKRFDEAKLRELANSVKAIGIAQPLLVRAYSPMNGNPPSGRSFGDMLGHYEIVAGERRYRSAKLAELAEVPCFIRELTNQQVLHIQLIENLQRDDLHPIEEAEGYERLMLEKDPDGHPYTADTIATEIGKSRSYVFQRRKLLALCPDAREAFYDGKLDASTALLIARIPVEKLQLQALKKLTEEAGWGNQFVATGDKMSFRRARALIQDEFMLDLDRAVFDPADAELLPKAGSCTACPQRTGNSRDLFDDVADDNICTDPVCNAMKKTAHVLRLQKQAEAEGAAVIKGKEAKKLIQNNWSSAEIQLREHGYATLDTLLPGDAQKRTLGQALEAINSPVQKTIVANPYRDGQMIETVSIEQSIKALREAGFEVTLKGSNASAQQSKQDQEKQREKEAAKLAIENVWRARLFDTLHEQIEAEIPNTKAEPLFQQINAMLAVYAFNRSQRHEFTKIIPIIRKYADLPESVKDNQWWPHITKFSESIHELSQHQNSMLMIDLLMVDEMIRTSHQYGNEKPETMLKLAEMVGIDANAIKKEVAAEAKAAAKAKAKPAEKPATKTPSTPTKAAQAQALSASEKTEAAPANELSPKEKTKRKAAAAACV